MDQRKIYHWANGQRSAATGREAGGHLPGYVKLIGNDSAIVVKGPKGRVDLFDGSEALNNIGTICF